MNFHKRATSDEWNSQKHVCAQSCGNPSHQRHSHTTSLVFDGNPHLDPNVNLGFQYQFHSCQLDLDPRWMYSYLKCNGLHVPWVHNQKYFVSYLSASTSSIRCSSCSTITRSSSTKSCMPLTSSGAMVAIVSWLFVMEDEERKKLNPVPMLFTLQLQFLEGHLIALKGLLGNLKLVSKPVNFLLFLY